MWALASDKFPLLYRQKSLVWRGETEQVKQSHSYWTPGPLFVCFLLFWLLWGFFFKKQSASVFPVKVTAWCCWYKWYLPVSPLAFWGTGALHFLALHALIHVWRGISNKAFIVKHLQERVVKASLPLLLYSLLSLYCFVLILCLLHFALLVSTLSLSFFNLVLFMSGLTDFLSSSCSCVVLQSTL